MRVVPANRANVSSSHILIEPVTRKVMHLKFIQRRPFASPVWQFLFKDGYIGYCLYTSKARVIKFFICDPVPVHLSLSALETRRKVDKTTAARYRGSYTLTGYRLPFTQRLHCIPW